MLHLQNASSGSSAAIAVEHGFNCVEFRAHLADGRVVDVLSTPNTIKPGQSIATHCGIPLLFPFPNRIAGGRYSWEGKDFHLPPGSVVYDESGNAIHGLCVDRLWRVTESLADSVTGTFRLSIDAPDRLSQWPTDAEIFVTYKILGSCLRCEIRVVNPTDHALPWGFGTHVYFNVPLLNSSTTGQCTLFVPARSIWELNKGLPTGRKKNPPDHTDLRRTPSLNGLKVDDIYSDIVSENGRIVCRITDHAAGVAVEQRCSTDFREFVVFTPPWNSAVCIEPYTCVTDAINLQQNGIDSGLRILQPGEEWTGWIEIEAVTLKS